MDEGDEAEVEALAKSYEAGVQTAHYLARCGHASLMLSEFRTQQAQPEAQAPLVWEDMEE